MDDLFATFAAVGIVLAIVGMAWGPRVVLGLIGAVFGAWILLCVWALTPERPRGLTSECYGTPPNQWCAEK